MNLCSIIEEAKCCSSSLGAKWSEKATNGEEDEELFFNFMRLNAYIRTLQRNEKTYKRTKKVIVTADLDDLLKGKSFLSLKLKEKVICTKTEIEPCLPESEICLIVENIRILCSTLDCNCN